VLVFVLIQEGKLTCTRFFPRWNDVVRNTHALVQEGKITHASFPPWWNNVVRDAFVLVQEEKIACIGFPHGRMMLFKMRLCLCKRKS
jgi:hypothetical protein